MILRDEDVIFHVGEQTITLSAKKGKIPVKQLFSGHLENAQKYCFIHVCVIKVKHEQSRSLEKGPKRGKTPQIGQKRVFRAFVESQVIG